MSEFNLFHYLDTAIVAQESRDPRASRTPSVWPSEASALRLDQTFHKIVGKCMRQVYLRMTGRPVANQVDAEGAWKWVTGRLMESNVSELARASQPKIFVASGVRTFAKDIYMPVEMDLVVLDPESYRPWILECKTYDGYYAAKEIETLGTPKLENLIQVCIYLLEARDGAAIKRLIEESYAERARLDLADANHRNRVEVDLEMLGKINVNATTGAKLVYISRGECKRTEFTIDVVTDFDGSRYPVVNGNVYRIFTIDSIYERFKEVQEHWFRARREAVRRLESRGITVPDTVRLVLAHGEAGDDLTPKTDDQLAAERTYMDRLVREVWTLPEEYLPQAEYQWAYSAQKIEQMQMAKQLTKKAYDGWKKKGEKVGDWQCLYCPYKSYCVPLQNPAWAYEVYDSNLVTIKPSDDVKE